MKLTIYALSLLIASLTFSCSTKEGEPGPAGTAFGKKQGTINGTLTYKDANNKDVSYPFDYQYYGSELNNTFSIVRSNGIKSFYNVNVSRFPFKQSETNGYTLSLSGQYVQGVPAKPTDVRITFGVSKEKSPDFYNFQTNYQTELSEAPEQDGESTIDITNFSFNESTGQMSFDYTIMFNYEYDIQEYYVLNYTTTPTITGSVSVKLVYNPYGDYNVMPALQ